jgi:hypothetical protein
LSGTGQVAPMLFASGGRKIRQAQDGHVR